MRLENQYKLDSKTVVVLPEFHQELEGWNRVRNWCNVYAISPMNSIITIFIIASFLSYTYLSFINILLILQPVIHHSTVREGGGLVSLVCCCCCVAVTVTNACALQVYFQNKTTSKVNYKQEYFAVGLALLKCADSVENTDRLTMKADYIYLNYYII